MTEATTTLRVGTVDVPARIDRERYFRELSYLELSATFAGPLKVATLNRWKAVAPAGALGVSAPWTLTHGKPPRGASGLGAEFREVPHVTVATLSALHDTVDRLAACCAMFHSPPLFAPSTDHRERLRRFFGELATPESVGATRVWIPDGLWETRDAIKFATELGIVCAIDPLVRPPGTPPEIHYDLAAEALYFRIQGAGRAGAIRTEHLEDLAALVEHYEDLPLTIAFESPERWRDARNLKKLLE